MKPPASAGPSPHSMSSDSTPRDAVVRSLSDLKDVAGVVFNQVSPGSFRRYYYHDAYSRYAYGEDVNEGEQ